MVAECFFLEVIEDCHTEPLLQTIAVEPEETLQPIPERERGEGGRERKKRV